MTKIVHPLLVFCLAFAVQAAERQLYTLDLQHSLPEQLIPALQPHLDIGSTLSPWQNKIIASITADEYRQLQLLLAELDVQGKELVISVRSSQPQRSGNSAYHSGGRINSGTLSVGSRQTGGQPSDNTTLVYHSDGTSTETRVTTSVSQRHSSSGSEQEHSLRVSEGLPAYISTGESTPYTYYDPGYGSQTEYRESNRGFYITAYVLDEQRVKLIIDHSNRHREGDAIAGEALSSSVVATIGQWLPIGAIEKSVNSTINDIGSRQSGSSNNNYQVYLKVDYP